jgi:hypothetical protein
VRGLCDRRTAARPPNAAESVERICERLPKSQTAVTIQLKDFHLRIVRAHRVCPHFRAEEQFSHSILSRAGDSFRADPPSTLAAFNSFIARSSSNMICSCASRRTAAVIPAPLFVAERRAREPRLRIHPDGSRPICRLFRTDSRGCSEGSHSII